MECIDPLAKANMANMELITKNKQLGKEIERLRGLLAKSEKRVAYLDEQRSEFAIELEKLRVQRKQERRAGYDEGWKEAAEAGDGRTAGW